jgi:lipopolysaccharide transport system ATP-binding protein
MENTIEVIGLSKSYTIGVAGPSYRTIRDLVTQRLSLLRLSARRGRSGRAKEFWALSDLAFTVKPGEAVGIIGRNGAGKSTLLKVLARITEPTGGYALVRGRVGSLLEIGTGFHPELSGRENIFLNAALLGMRRSEIRRKFDEIVAFAEVDQFLDTPVKHYSSGMYVRLAFAVAAHLETEILLVDEVLAVGDAAFQKKCLGKMNQVTKEGRTVLFISHNMSAVKALCERGLVLEAGRLVYDGKVGQAIYEYHRTLSGEPDDRRNSEAPSHGAVIGPMRVNGQIQPVVELHQPLRVTCELASASTIDQYWLFCLVQDASNNVLVHAQIDERELGHVFLPGRQTVCMTLPPLWLRPGVYTVTVKLIVGRGASAGRFQGDPVMVEVEGEVATSALHGMLTPLLQWEVGAAGEAVGAEGN